MSELGALTGHRALAEQFDREHACGWVEALGGEHAGVPAVDLFVDHLRVASVFAGAPVQRTGAGDVREFRFDFDELWDFVGPRNRLRLQVASVDMPITGHGMFVVPRSAGERPLEELAQRLSAGEAFGRTGRLQLPKSLDERWQHDALALYAELANDINDITGASPFLAYGTLLGAIRDHSFIGHDLDFDCAIIAGPRDAAAAARDLQQLSFALIDRGYAVRARPTFVQVSRPGQPEVMIDIFHLYFDESGGLRFPHGVANTDRLTSSEWSAPVEHDFGGTKVLVPAAPEHFLEHVYGPGWRSPDPSFSWARERREQATDALLPAPVIEEIYWADFYARTEYSTGSTFFELVNARADLPRTIVDIGCGDGRDSYAFAAAGWDRVTGLDRSHVGVRQATRKAVQLGYQQLTFTACDVSDAERLRATLQQARGNDDPMVFYARFFLHSIPEEIQHTLMEVVADCARPGDWFAAEFRTDRDQSIRKVHGNHYRRFQNGAAFGRALRETYGFAPVLEQEGNGFSPYNGEDPQLYRVLARRS